MKQRTDRYYEAAKAGAIPIVYAVVGTDRAYRVLGKTTPTDNFCAAFPFLIFERAANVLTFGEFTETVSSDSENMLTSLTVQEMNVYRLTCDNADRYYSLIIGRGEEFLGGRFWLYQGFDYPGFVFSDFFMLLSGQINDYYFTRTHFDIMVDTSITSGFPPDDLTVSVDKIYGYQDDGTGVILQESFTYTETETFFVKETWTRTYQIYRESTGSAEVIFRVESDTWGSTRLEIGIDATDHLYVKMTEDAQTLTPAYDTYTMTSTVPAGLSSIKVEYNAETGELILAVDDDSETFSTLAFTTLSSFNLAYDSYQIDTDDGNNIYTTYGTGAGDGIVRKYDSTGVLQLTIQPSGGDSLRRPRSIVVDDTGNMYVPDYSHLKVTVFDSFGNITTSWDFYDSPNHYPWGIALVTGGILYVGEVQTGNRVYAYDLGGTLIRDFSFIGDESYAIAVSPSGSTIVLVSTVTTNIGQAFSPAGNLYFTFGEDEDLSGTACAAFDLSENIYVGCDSGLLVYNANGSYLGAWASPSGKVEGVSINIDGNIVVNVNTGALTRTIYTMRFAPKKFDNRDDGGNNTFTAGDPFNGVLVVDEIEIDPLDGVLEEITEEGENVYEYDVLTEFVLTTTTVYPSPGSNQQNVSLPHPIGDMTENSDLGAWVCPCVDSVNFRYCVAAWPVVPVAYGNTVSVYVDGVLQTSGYTFTDSTDFESQGNIAMLTFTSDPGGVVTVKCKGWWVDNSFPTNPVDVIEHLLDYVAEQSGQIVWQPDPASFAQGRAFCNTHGYTCAGVILKNNTISFYLNEIMASFAGKFSFSAAGKLRLTFLPLSYSEDIVTEIEEGEALHYNLRKNIENVAETIIINYAVSTVEIDRRFKAGSRSSYFRTWEEENTEDLSYSGKVWELNFDWTRNTATVQTIANRLMELYGQATYTLTYSGFDFSFIPIELFDHIRADLSIKMDENGDTQTSQVYELREKKCNLDDFTTSLVAQELNDITLGNSVYIGNYQVYIGTNKIQIGG